MITGSEIGAVVLSGGDSRRMGQDKGLTLYNDKPLVNYATEALASVFEGVSISSNKDEYRTLGFPIIEDEYPGNGPMAGIHAALKSSEKRALFVLSCDMPKINSKLVSYILSKYEPGKICLPRLEGRAAPLCGIYPADLLDDLENSLRSDHLKLIRFVEKHFTKYIDLDDTEWADENIFQNINSPEDLQSRVDQSN